MGNHSVVTVRGEKPEKVKVQITSDSKPEIVIHVLEKWQTLIDTAAKLAHVPTGLIMQLKKDTIQVLVKSDTPGNPYGSGDSEKLVYGLYCESVVGKKTPLVVPNAIESDLWKDDNPDIDINMIAYLGYPISWPDGEVLGTVCLLDNKENTFQQEYRDMVFQLKKHIENDLKVLLLQQEMEMKNKQLEELNNVKSTFLSLISHDVRGNVGTMDEFLKLLLAKFEELDRPALQDMLTELSQSAGATYQTLENLLYWAKNDLTKLQPNAEQVDLVGVIETVLKYFRQILRIKDIHVIKHYSEEKALLTSDEKMLMVSIRNIISNAIKYNQKGGEVKISVSQKDGEWQVIISDTGTGMSQEVLDKLFSYNADHHAGTQGESSAGIGLLLTKEFLNKLNVGVVVESEVGHGTTFTLSL